MNDAPAAYVPRALVILNLEVTMVTEALDRLGYSRAAWAPFVSVQRWVDRARLESTGAKVVESDEVLVAATDGVCVVLATADQTPGLVRALRRLEVQATLAT